MDFALSAEQEELRSYARTVLKQRLPPAVARSMMQHATAHDPEAYGELAALGWTGVAIPEGLGGQGATYVELAVLLEEMGRTLMPGPFFATVGLAAPVLSADAGSEVARDLLHGIAAGSVLATVAWTGESGVPGLGGVAASAMGHGDQFCLDGVAGYVPDAHVADRIIVAATEPDGGARITLFVVDPASPGVEVTQVECLDRTRRLCTVAFSGTVVSERDVVGAYGEGRSLLDYGLNVASVLIAAESVGGANAVLDESVDYARVRTQFGRAIGTFQAVKHRLADVLVTVELGRTAEYYGAWAATAGPAELPMAAAIAKAYCTAAYTAAAEIAIQTHGGIGFTWEHDLHLYLRRAKTNELLLGQPAYHYEQLAALLAG
jgi:alkylation response protein AidB-like acyl-CoA dehydrogenase